MAVSLTYSQLVNTYSSNISLVNYGEPEYCPDCYKLVGQKTRMLQDPATLTYHCNNGHEVMGPGSSSLQNFVDTITISSAQQAINKVQGFGQNNVKNKKPINNKPYLTGVSF